MTQLQSFHILIAVAALLAGPVLARGDILCRRDAEITPVQPKFTADDPCLGSVKLQGVSFKCAAKDDYDDLMRGFLDDIATNGRKRCQEYCRQLSPNCYGHFDAPSRCGWSVPRGEVLHVGATAPCPDHCDGKAFIYCSIYHASYLRVEESAFTEMRPNCTCDHSK